MKGKRPLSTHLEEASTYPFLDSQHPGESYEKGETCTYPFIEDQYPGELEGKEETSTYPFIDGHDENK